MCHDDDEFRPEVQHGVLDTGDARRVGHVARDAYDEQVTEPGVEYDLCRYPAVRTAENDGEWPLTFDEFLVLQPNLTRAHCTSGPEALVALL